MSPRRLALIFRHDLAHQSRRPIVWMLILLLGITAWGLSIGDVRISSGDSSVGGTKAWITSEFNNAKLFAMEVFLFYALFLAIVAGMAVLQDDEHKVGEILHATPLQPREYLWGKFLSILAAFIGVLALHIVATAFFNHILPHPKGAEFRGPFGLTNYLRPALVFGLPIIVFIAGTAFAIGERSRRPILVFFLPVATMLFSAFFLWNWSPSWLSPGINRLLMLIDPAGVRWISETWLKVDRGVEFYNHAPVTFDVPFLLSRLAFVAIGLVAVAVSERHFARALRGAAAARRGRATLAQAGGIAALAASEPEETHVAGDGPTRAAPFSTALLGGRASGIRPLRGAAHVLRFELAELKSQPGLYLFIPLILLQTLGTCLTAVGAFDTPVLLTPGTIAVQAVNTLTLLNAFLLLFYTVESLRRERNTGLFQIYYATPTPTASILFGKVLANALVAVVVTLATFVGAAIALLVQGKVGLSLLPFLWVWGVLLIPTYLVWTSFVMFLYALTNNRYTTYGLGLSALALTGLLQMLGKMSWVGNWDLWSVLRWSDLGTFELDRLALLLNRVAVLGLSVFFVALTLRLFPRHDRDATRIVHRLSGPAILSGSARMVPYAVVPAAALVALLLQVDSGFQGRTVEKLKEDYWRQNLATWKDAPTPDMRHVAIDLDLEPARRGFRVDGSYALVNREERALARFAFTGGTHWSDVTWTMNGAEYKPEDRSRLYVFTPPAPLQPGDTLQIGFHYQGRFPKGITKNGGGASEFILPSGVVLTSFSPAFVPVPGFQEDIGVDKDNRYEPRIYPDDFYRGVTKPIFGTRAPFTTRIRVTAPEAYTVNAVGVKVSDTTTDGKRTVVWESDQPVRFFNIVAGRWQERRGQNTALYYHRGHDFNVDEMSAGLDAALRWYSEWFYPYPWRELKLSEFPALAFYAQGFPSNITFSEGIGFLTKSDPRSNAAFMVTAHESAHQWWANLLTPGEGPGAEILAEGMAHFSTGLLTEQEKGLGSRIEFFKRIEANYGDDRQVDSERPLVKIDGSRAGDETVKYDKGGWVFWMLLNHMGREQALAGIRHFIEVYKDGPDYPVLQDFVAAMRPFAPDSTAYDEFVQRWFYQVVVPEYRLTDARRTGDEGAWTATVRVKNAGSGRIPVEVAAVSGERFDKQGQPEPAYRDARTTVLLDAGEEQEVAIACDFEPERIVVDPDALVLQLMRKAAVAAL
jgi:ABC-2 type transport system permease protein